MFQMFISASAFNQALCWSHTGKPTTDMFVLSSGSANANQAKCSCGPGTYYTGASCASCSAGQYSARGRLASCFSCAPGTGSPAASAACFVPTPEPTPEPAPEPTQPTPEPTSNPTPFCNNGDYLSGGECTACPLGQYRLAGSIVCNACQLCPTGQCQDARGEASCNDCPEGKLSSANRFSCDTCQAGQYANLTQAECADCKFGRYAPVPQRGACLKCGPGLKTGKKAAATPCTRCDAGTWSSGLDWNCTACPAGQFSASGAALCTDCSAGFVAP